jgi:D-glycero-D-manno-heptose 1,7-bisphosphate phosphatase
MNRNAAQDAITVFADRDGTVNKWKPYLWRIGDFEFIEGVPEAIARLNRASAQVILATNQSGVARGYYTEGDVVALHAYVQEALRNHGAHIDAFYYCPHLAKGVVETYARDCECRKPKPGMLLRAIRERALPERNRFMVGDRLHDMAAGAAAGCVTVLVRTGYGEREAAEIGAGAAPDHIADDFPAAVAWILTRAGIAADGDGGKGTGG